MSLSGYTNPFFTLTLDEIPRFPRHGLNHLGLHSWLIPSLPSRNWLCAHSSLVEVSVNPVDDRMLKRYMESHLKRMNEELEMAVPLRHPLRLHESMRHTLMSGRKRVMSALCIESCKLVGGDETCAVPTACAIEMLLAMSLIHDDLPCMDNADLRRGKPSNHIAFDEATALLAEDVLLCLAFEHVACRTQNVPPQWIIRVIQELSWATGSEGIQGGQIVDKLCEGRRDMSLAELEYIHTHKAARIIGTAIACGAIMGGGTEDEVGQIRRFGDKAGFLFQVVDDIIDVTKTTQVLGKITGSDLARDKLTYPKIMGIEGAKDYASQLLEDVFQELSYFDAARAAPIKSIVSFVYNQQN